MLAPPPADTLPILKRSPAVKHLAILAVTLTLASPSFANIPKVVAARAIHTGKTWRFDVTLKHADEGWQHYADGWSILDDKGTLLGHRRLLHPHVDEQPFTRSLGNVPIPRGVTHVLIRPHDLVHGDGPDFPLDLK